MKQGIFGKRNTTEASILDELIKEDKVIIAPFIVPAYIAKLGYLKGRKCTVYPVTDLINILIENGDTVYVWNNTVVGHNPNTFVASTYSNISLLEAIWEGDGNINSNPLFADTLNNDYSLEARFRILITR